MWHARIEFPFRISHGGRSKTKTQNFQILFLDSPNQIFMLLTFISWGFSRFCEDKNSNIAQNNEYDIFFIWDIPDLSNSHADQIIE